MPSICNDCCLLDFEEEGSSGSGLMSDSGLSGASGKVSRSIVVPFAFVVSGSVLTSGSVCVGAAGSMRKGVRAGVGRGRACRLGESSGVFRRRLQHWWYLWWTLPGRRCCGAFQCLLERVGVLRVLRTSRLLKP